MGHQQLHGCARQGSEVVLLNVHEGDDVAAALKKLGRCHNISLRHLQGNPLHKDDLKKVRSPSAARAPPMQHRTQAMYTVAGRPLMAPQRLQGRHLRAF